MSSVVARSATIVIAKLSNIARSCWNIRARGGAFWMPERIYKPTRSPQSRLENHDLMAVRLLEFRTVFGLDYKRMRE